MGYNFGGGSDRTHKKRQSLEHRMEKSGRDIEKYYVSAFWYQVYQDRQETA